MALYELYDGLMCRLFPSSLKGAALTWFHFLPPLTIRNFEEVGTMFAEHFICSRRSKKDLGDIVKIQMRSGETIRQYVDHFSILKFEVEDCNEGVAIMAFQNGLPSKNGLKESLIKRTPSDLRDLMGRAEKYAKKPREKDQRGEKGKKPGASTNEVREGQGMFF
ncbi:hypothetical protein QJS04_geneDACA014976 [Acorus gramineus]|uniref:Retrotransposon gag domain-containing protein n=1 Tax=Acorus gramineus TaxID=55184 RepID=A0AAV9AN27_ACOGR|nr:hypothetical protein QJS04_geneDACA014976 [Acorus gramineus]